MCRVGIGGCGRLGGRGMRLLLRISCLAVVVIWALVLYHTRTYEYNSAFTLHLRVKRTQELK